MKTKTKLILLSAALSCAVLGGIGATTFAWFTTSAQSQMRFSKITVGSYSPNIKTIVKAVNPNNWSGVTSTILQNGLANNFNISANISDVSSSYGSTFYRVNPSSTSDNDRYVAIAENSMDNYVFRFKIEVTTLAINTEHQIQISMNWGAFVENGQSTPSEASTKLASWMRGGIVEYTSSDYASASASTSVAFTDRNAALDYVNGVKATDIGTIENQSNRDSFAEFSRYRAATTKFFMCAIWMEGMLADNQDAARGGSIWIDLKVKAVATN